MRYSSPEAKGKNRRNNRLRYFLLKWLTTPDLFDETNSCDHRVSFSEQGTIFWEFVPRFRRRNSSKFRQSIPPPEANNCTLWRIPYVDRFDGDVTEGAKFGVPVHHTFFFIPSHHQDQWHRAYRCRVARSKARLPGNFVASGPGGPSLRVYTCDAHNASGTGSNASPHNVAHDRSVCRSTMKTIFAQGKILNCGLHCKNWKSSAFANNP